MDLPSDLVVHILKYLGKEMCTAQKCCKSMSVCGGRAEKINWKNCRHKRGDVLNVWDNNVDWRIGFMIIIKISSDSVRVFVPQKGTFELLRKSSWWFGERDSTVVDIFGLKPNEVERSTTKVDNKSSKSSNPLQAAVALFL